MIPFSVIIPARLSSSRLPNKALADIHGEPMVVRAAKQALKSHANQVWVATDHTDIAEVCQHYSIPCVMTASHHQSGTTRLAEAAALLQLPQDQIIVNVQGDEPMMPPELINRLAEKLFHSSAPMATAAHPITDFLEFTNPNCVKVVLDKHQNALYFSRAMIAYPRDTMLQHSQDLPQPLPLRHIGIYAYRTHFLQSYANMSASPLEQIESLEQLRVLWHGEQIAVEIIQHAPPAGVDTLEDLERVRQQWFE